MKRLVTLVTALAGIFAAVSPRAEMPATVVSEAHINNLSGKSGKGLSDAIRKEFKPQKLNGTDGLTCDLQDHFTGGTVSIINGCFPAGYESGEIVPHKWWTYIDEAGGDDIKKDLNNLIPMTADDIRRKSDLLPGKVDIPEFSSAYWSVGIGRIYGKETDLYSPPEQLRGRVARAFFYAAVMYPADIFTPRGYNMMDTDYPYFSVYGKELLVRWSKEYPVTPEEMEWEARVAAMQGGGNPFVKYAELSEYIWGDKAGEVYRVGDDPVPLHSTYHLEIDRVYLSSPHIPADAVWKIDGTTVTSKVLEASEIGIGSHDLEYSSESTGETGRMMIKIVP